MAAHLSNIYFIDSANMRYERVSLSANAHLFGTQGSGKTTIEHAVNFFYTTKKPSVSSDSGKAPFDKFYFPLEWSYIIYEVEREDDNGKFCVFVYKDGRLFFRFIDAPYDQDWVIDPETHATRKHHSLVIKNISEKGIYNMSVKTYENYRDVIYGKYNPNIPRKDFERFLVHKNEDPAGYISVLNSMYLSDRINTETLLKMVVNSERVNERNNDSNDSVARINLARIRNLLKDYKLVNENIKNWNDQKGPVYSATTDAIEAFNKLNGLEGEQAILLGEIKYLLERSERETPALISKIRNLSSQIVEATTRKKNLSGEYNKERENIIGEKAEYDTNIKQCNEIEKEWNDERIQKCRTSETLLPLTEAELAGKKRELEIHRHDNLTITEKYDGLRRSREEERDKAVRELNKSLQTLRNKYNSQNARINDENIESAQKSQEEQFQDQSNIMEETINVYDKMVSNRERLIDIYNIDNFEKEYEEYETKRNSIINSIQNLQDNLEKAEFNKNRLQKRKNNEIDSIDKKHSDNLRLLTEDWKKVSSRKEVLEGYMNNIESSLYVYLDNVQPEWYLTILGDILTDEIVYTSIEESESKTEYYNSLVNILKTSGQPGSANPKVHTPEEVRKLVADLKEEADTIKNKIENANKEKLDALSLLNNKFDQDIKNIKSQISEYNMKLSAEKKRLEVIECDWTKYRQTTYNTRQEEIKKINEEYSEYIIKRDGFLGRLKDIKKAFSGIWSKIKNLFDAKRDKLEKEFKESESSILNEINRQNSEYDKEIEILNEKKNKELSGINGGGVDLPALEKKVFELEAKKETLEKEKNDYSVYLSYKENFLDKKESYKVLYNNAVERLKRLELEHKENEDEISKLIDNLDTEKKSCEKTRDRYNKGVDSAISILSEAKWAEKFKAATAIENDSDCTTRIESIRKTEEDFHVWSEILRKNVSTVNDKLKQHDTFGFKRNLFVLDDYRAYAENLRDFREDGDIERTIKLHSNSYIDALVSANNDFKNVELNQKETIKSINAINRDLAGKGFCNVIKNIELMLTVTDESLVRVFDRIKSFCEDHRDEINLNSLTLWNDNEAVTKEYTEIVNSLLSKLDKPEYAFSDNIHLHNLYTLKVKAEENTNKGDWSSSLHEIGSNGTGIIIRALIYISFVSRIREKNGQTSPMHFIIDETGTLADQNLEGLVQYANDKNFIVLSASPQCPMSSLGYKYIHHIIKNDITGISVIERVKISKDYEEA